MGFLGKLEVGRNFCNVKFFFNTLKISVFCKLVIVMVFLLKFNTLKIGVFCKMVILVVFKLI